MYFKVKWGDFVREFKRKSTPETDLRTKYYFETDTSILIFLCYYGIIEYCEVLKNSIDKVDNFKMEYLSTCKELVENPFKLKVK